MRLLEIMIYDEWRDLTEQQNKKKANVMSVSRLVSVDRDQRSNLERVKYFRMQMEKKRAIIYK